MTPNEVSIFMNRVAQHTVSVETGDELAALKMD
jgi:hypothetical protein